MRNILDFAEFSSPFSGIFFQFDLIDKEIKRLTATFSSPFLGTFLQFVGSVGVWPLKLVFVPFLGDFFSISGDRRLERQNGHYHVFVPFLGDFFSIVKFDGIAPFIYGFRPLSRGLFFNDDNDYCR